MSYKIVGFLCYIRTTSNIIACLLCISTIAIFMNLLITMNWFKTKSISVIGMKMESQRSRDSLLILAWTPICNSSGWEEGDLRAPRCRLDPGVHCEFRREQPSLYNLSHAVMFTGHYVEGPKRLYLLPGDPRPKGQKWIFYMNESPINQAISKPYYSWIYNITSTYMMHSDVKSALCSNFLTSITKPCRLSPTWNSSRTEMVKKVRQKTELVAWFAGHCSTKGGREDYINELSKHIKIDIYGGCGTLECKRKFPADYEHCDLMLDRKYKFYLSFENSLCKDYVTEKLFRMFKKDVVPIVRGAANYSRFMPQGTYIDVKDFDTPKDLANFLQMLNKREDLYLDYLLKKETMTCVDEEPYLCRLCRHLHANRHKTERVDLFKFWNQSLCHFQGVR